MSSTTFLDEGLAIARRLRCHTEVAGLRAVAFGETGGLALAASPGVYNGTAGVRLMYAEAARVAPHDEWPVCLDLPSSGAEVGLFSGNEGAVVAAWAERRACLPLSEAVVLPPAEAGERVGDLMNGLPGRLWAALCVGAQHADKHPFVPDVPGPAGLAHGRAGWIAAGACSWSECLVGLVEILDAEASCVAGPPYAWCNGLAGLAVAAAMTWHRFGDEPGDLSGRARRWATAALNDARCSEMDGGGLCHGVIGGIVAGGQVAAVLNDGDLLELAVEALLDVALAARSQGWLGGHMDRSFMTGAVGVAWALLVVGRSPLVSPLLPLAGAAHQPVGGKGE